MMIHNFHIPVLGLSFSIDTPVKVARYGITSVISLSSDALIEDMRAHYSREYKRPYSPISDKEHDYRARRITAYLNLLKSIVDEQFESLRSAPMGKEGELSRYLDLLPEDSQLKSWYHAYCESDDTAVQNVLEQFIRNSLQPGGIDVNIMTKVDKTNYDKDGNPLEAKYSDALAALRGFAMSELGSAVVLSAGFNPRLYSYLGEFDCFFPNALGELPKRVILKVSDYRSALVQGKFLAKKGIWVSEFRIESGLNCGGHAFATEGLLMGPILQEFKDKKQALADELFALCQGVWQQRGMATVEVPPAMDITVQGGIGTHEEQAFLMHYYQVKSTGWGTPFLLVPEATTVDEPTMQKLAAAKSKDLYLSKSSPLGVPFNNIRDSQSDSERLQKINKDRPGSPCHKKYLVSNTEFTKEPICTASRQYQHLKLKELDGKELTPEAYKKAYDNITVKSCLCEDLAAPAYVNYKMKPKVKPATAICPGPNMAFFSRQYSLAEMVKHIYGKTTLLQEDSRPHMFINELKMYIDYLADEWTEAGEAINAKKQKYLQSFRKNLHAGIEYYEKLGAEIKLPTFKADLAKLEARLRYVGLHKALA